MTHVNYDMLFVKSFVHVHVTLVLKLMKNRYTCKSIRYTCEKIVLKMLI